MTTEPCNCPDDNILTAMPDDEEFQRLFYTDILEIFHGISVVLAVTLDIVPDPEAMKRMFAQWIAIEGVPDSEETRSELKEEIYFGLVEMRTAAADLEVFLRDKGAAFLEERFNTGMSHYIIQSQVMEEPDAE